MSNLNALTALDGRYSSDVKGLEKYFSEAALIKFRVMVEVKYFSFLLNKFGINYSYDELMGIHNSMTALDYERIKDIERVTKHDVKAVEYWIKEEVHRRFPGLRSNLELIHFGLTSEDINNLAYALMQKGAFEQVLGPALINLTRLLKTNVEQYANTPMISRTHGQPATPTTLGKELGVFLSRLVTELHVLEDIEFTAKLNGATGTFGALSLAVPEEDWLTFSADFIRSFGLKPEYLTTQISNRDSYARVYDSLKRVNNILIDLSQDIWQYVSLGYFDQKITKGQVGSSAMPHKIHPINFENAAGNLGLANVLFNHFSDKLTKSRMQRDLSDSTVLRNIGTAYGYSLVAYKSLVRGLNTLEANTARLNEDLDRHPEVISEGIQTIMRFNGVEEPYEKFKDATQGKKISLETLKSLAGDKLPPKFSPADYIGQAPALAKLACEQAEFFTQDY